MKKFDKVFKKTDKKLENNSHIDFEKSSVNKPVSTQEKPKEIKQKRTIRIQTYLTENEFLQFKETMKILEKPSERLREVLIEDIKKRKKVKNPKS